MALNPEYTRLLAEREVSMSHTFRDIMERIPDTVKMAKIEAADSRMAKTPEGKFALTYLLAARDLLKPALQDLTNISPDLLVATGGSPHNPERNIDAVGTEIIFELAGITQEIPNFWMRSEESADWQHLSREDASSKEGMRFAVVDPLDMTSSIPRRDRVQTTGIAIYDRDGQLKTLGIQSLVDEEYVFIENIDGSLVVHPHDGMPEDAMNGSDTLRIAAKTRRMQYLKKLPVFTEGNLWVMDCDSGFATLGLHRGNVDTVIDHLKGSVWYEVVIWVRAAQALGFTVSDKDGNPIDISAIMRRVIDKHEGDTYRVPFVISRTPDIHKRVLPLLTPSDQ